MEKSRFAEGLQKLKNNPLRSSMLFAKGMILAGLLAGVASACTPDASRSVSDEELTRFCLDKKSAKLIDTDGHIEHFQIEDLNQLDPDANTNVNLAFVDSAGNTFDLSKDPKSDDSFPNLSRDKKKVVFSRSGPSRIVDSEIKHDFSGKEGLYSVRSDGTEMKRLTVLEHNMLEDRYPAFSSDGAKIVFVRTDFSEKSPVDSLYTINADGTGQPKLLTKISDDKGYIVRPAFSPDGLHVAFEGKKSTHVIDSNGENHRQISQNSHDETQGVDAGFDWLPNSRQLLLTRAFRVSDRDFLQRSFLIGADGWGEREVSIICPPSGNDRFD